MRKQTTGAREISEQRLAELKKNAAGVLAQARRAMMQRQPFTGSVAMNLEIVPVRDVRIDTAATDGKHVFFDIDFLSGLSPEDRVFVFGHEVWHCLMCHFARTENRDRELMNVATDLEVNQILAKDGFTVPSGALMPDRFGFPPDLPAEEYYELLVEKNETPKTGSGLDSQFDRHVYSGDDADGMPSRGRGGAEGACEISDKYGKVGIDPDFRPEDPKGNVERVREAAVSASQVLERTRGTLPDYIKGLVQALLKPELDWREQLQQFVTRTCCGEKRDWNPPNRRGIWSGTYLQSRKGEKIRVAVGLDVSGSTAGDIPKFLGELNGLVKSFGKYTVDVIQCDTEVKSANTYTDDDGLDLETEKFEIAGGGGTTLHPIFERIESDPEMAPDAIVVMTDGYCEPFKADEAPAAPVLWLVTKGGNKGFAEFGEVVEFKEKAA